MPRIKRVIPKCLLNRRLHPSHSSRFGSIPEECEAVTIAEGQF